MTTYDFRDLMQAMNSLAPIAYDAIVLSYTGSNVTKVEYKVKGATGEVVVTLNLGYDLSGNLITIERV
jgi:hypothetical protein